VPKFFVVGKQGALPESMRPMDRDFKVKTQFRTIDELRSFIDRICQDNHVTCGRWSAAQNFYHLAGAFDGSLHELPAGYPRMVRLLVRPFRWIVTRYRFPPWLPIPASIRHRLEPPSDADFDEQKARLLAAVDAFQSHVGEHPSHPVLGKLTRDDWVGFHLRHCSHHLSFLRIIE
jgi:hypothetical protein